jgi:glycosyl transferase family 25
MYFKLNWLNISKLVIIILSAFLIYPAGYFVLDSKKVLSIPPIKVIPKSVGAYIINLERSSDRYFEVKPLVNQLEIPFERIAAIEGAHLSDSEINQLVDFDTYQHFFKQLPKKGTMGCSLSHIKAWQTFLNSHFEYALIFEDDVRFDAKTLKVTIDDLIEHNSYWDINSFELHHRGLPITIKSLKNDQKLVNYLLPVTHTGAYMINRKAAKRLLEKALPIKMPVDHYFTRVWELGLIFTGIENPRLVYQKQGFSEIESTSRAHGSDKISLLKIKRGIYGFKTGIIRVFYNLKCVLTSRDK